jgi:hypothetical protein
VQISFVKSGGFAGRMTRVEGAIDLRDSHGEITGAGGYHRQLESKEIDMVRAGAQPQLLFQAASTLASVAAASGGMADVEQYKVNIKTSDGKDQEIILSTSGADDELNQVPPAAAKFISWLQQETQKILAEKMKSR